MKSIVEYLEDWAQRQPDTCLGCFVDGAGRELASHSYRGCAQRTRAVAHHLRRRAGLRQGDRVLLVYPPGLELIVAFLGCARLGVIPVPVAPPARLHRELGLARLAFVARDSGARVALTTADYLRSHGQLLGARGAATDLAGSPARPSLTWLPTDAIDGMAAPQAADDSPGDLLFLQYTSGSTSEPKGVMVSHENVITNALSIIDHVPIAVSWLPQYHDMGLIGYGLFPIIGGGTTYRFAPMDFLKRPLLWFETITRYRATDTSSPNFGLEYCLREDKVPSSQLRGVDLRSLRVLMNAAEPVRAETHRSFLDRFAACGLRSDAHVVAYGLAEITLAATHYGRRILSVDAAALRQGVAREPAAAGDRTHVQEIVSCGRPLPGVRVRIVDAVSARALGDDQVGEIWLSSQSSGLGYWQRPELSRQIFCNRLADASADGGEYVRTGDLGFLHEGELFVCGRAKDVIIINGANFHPQDVERVVAAATRQVRPLGIAAFNGARNGEALVVVAEVRQARDLPDPVELARTIRTHCGISPWQIVFVPAGAIARTTSGKNARYVTRRRYLAGELPILAVHTCGASDVGDAPGERLTARFQRILAPYHLTGTEPQTFADVGLDSLALVDLILGIRQVLAERGAAELMAGIDTPLLQRLTVAEFFRLLEQLEREPPGRCLATWGELLARRQEDYQAQVEGWMRRDAVLDGEPIGLPGPARPVGQVLLTGGTGFFGPHLLSSLLQRTRCGYHVLVRARDPAHGRDRLRSALEQARLITPALATAFEDRVRVVCGDVSLPHFGLDPDAWALLARETDAVFHNAALVDYVRNYEALRPHNVEGTREALRFARAVRPKEFHHVSSTFIFGWTARGLLVEDDHNAEMANLDFGYAQTKWVAEQLVLAAGRGGLWTRVYRPSLISAASSGVWDGGDIAVRLLAFMINHGIAVRSRNQISFLPADVVADNLAAIFADAAAPAGTLHVTTDEYYNMADVTSLITARYGWRFTYYEIPEFITEMNRRCTSDDLLYPLLDFFNRSFEKIAAMQLKRYNNDRYRAARSRAEEARATPSLDETVDYMIQHLQAQGLISRALRSAPPTSSDYPANAMHSPA